MRLVSRLFLAVTVLAFTAGPLLGFPAADSLGLRLVNPQTDVRHPSAPGVELLAPLGIAGAIRIKDTGALAKKFVRNASAAGPDYTSGVQAAGQDWATNTAAAEDNYKVGVQQAAADGRFGRGVAAAGAAKYVNKASTLGAQRYPTGVAAAEGDWAKGVQPHLDMMKGLNLPPRRAKGDPSNFQRSQVVAQANRNLKTGK